MKLAFLGGSFNPPHKGHLQAAEFAKKILGVQMVIFLVTPQNPFKSAKELLPLPQRVKLLKNLITKPWMKISTIETKFRKAESINTVRLLKKLYPNDTIYFILGTDNLEHFHRWKGSAEILEKTKTVFINRGGTNMHTLLRKGKTQLQRAQIIYKKTVKISSTEIRQATYCKQ